MAESRWQPSKRLEELIALVPETAPVIASSVVECLSEWAMRYYIDSQAEEDGSLRHGCVPELAIYMEAAWRQCIDQGLIERENP